jgi:CBS domain-containing protein
MEHLDTFLARHPPFDSLAPDELGAVAAEAEERRFEPGEVVLVEDGLPAQALYVVRSGSMDLVHEGEVIDVIEPGGCFGHPSLLSGMAPTFTVRAREPSDCVLIGVATARRVLGTDAGLSYVATTMRQRLTRTGQTVHALPEVGTTPVREIARPAVFCDADAEVREAARRLGEDGVSALLVRVGQDGQDDVDALGIVTDADLRARVASGELPIDAPVRALARTPVPTVAIAQLAVEATIVMLHAGVEHVAVLDGGRVVGLLSAGDLLGVDARSPIALRHAIQRATNEDALLDAVGGLPKLFRLLVRAGVSPRDIGRVLSLQHDALIARLIDFSLERHGPAPLPWAWLDLGSAARREFTLASDQDNALAYATPSDGEEAAVDEYFARLGGEVNDGLARCGFGVDNNGVLAGNRLWRMSKAAWLKTFDECLRVPDESHLIRATVSFDFRVAAGGLTIDAPLSELMRAAAKYPDFVRLLARSATGYPVALGFRGQLAVERRGEHAGSLDLKRGAIIPLVNLVRFHAIERGITISPTLDRIEAIASAGGLEPGVADALAEAFIVIARLRFEHHAALIAAGKPPDNLIDPGELPPIARGELREALLTVRRGQKQLGVWQPVGL